ncbi:hypothetical protein HDK90DRAFT_466256 [Phyllosticta capitalensis]|uniref:Uncharacterized protein n=1 Tax=Phyllosticta capitalensis TaxID=121624 RepID=A0ABR1YR69_9PEZI
MAPQWMLARLADVKSVAATIFPCYQPRKKVGLEITTADLQQQSPTDFRRLEVKLEGLTPEQEAFLRQKAAIESLPKPTIPPLPTTFASAPLPSGYTSASAPSSPRTIVATAADFSSSTDATPTIPAHPETHRTNTVNKTTFTRESSAPFIPPLFSFAPLQLPQPAADADKPPVPPRSPAREICKLARGSGVTSASAPDLRRPQARDGAEVSRLDRARGTARRWRWSAGLRASWKEAHPPSQSDGGLGVVGWDEKSSTTTSSTGDGAAAVSTVKETESKERVDEGFEVQVVKGAATVSVKSLALGRDSVTLGGSERDCDFEIVSGGGGGQVKEVRG